MAGVRTNINPVRAAVHAYNSGAVTAALTLTKYVMASQGRILAVVANAGTAGSGAGNTVLDILVNGVSIYTTTANRPTLAAASTGEFANTLPDTKELRRGDVVTLQCATISTTGHADLAFTVLIGLPN